VSSLRVIDHRLTFKKGVFTFYKSSVFEERQKQAREEVAANDS